MLKDSLDWLSGSRHNADPLGKGHKLRQGFDLHLLHHVVAMGLHGTCGTAYRPSDLLVVVAANDTLNIRKGPSAGYALVSTFKPGERGVTSTGRVAWAKGQCTTTCSGAEGGLSDVGRYIAYGCKAKGQIWYEVRRANGAVGWASGKFLDLADDGMVIEPPPPPKPEIVTQRTYSCGLIGPLVLSIYSGNVSATVKIGGTSFHVVRQEHLVLRYAYGAGDGARLRGGPNLVEWRWPNGKKVNCTAG